MKSLNPPGRYVRIKFNGKWHWAVKKLRPTKIRGVPHPTYVVVDEEGNLPSYFRGEAAVETTNLLIGHLARKPRPSGRGGSASALRLDVTFHHCQRSPTTGHRAVARTPEVPPVQLGANFGQPLGT